MEDAELVKQEEGDRLYSQRGESQRQMERDIEGGEGRGKEGGMVGWWEGGREERRERARERGQRNILECPYKVAIP